MNCKNFRIRTKDYKRYFYCIKKRHEIILQDCRNCSEIDLKRNKTIKKKSTRLANLENNRTSILQEDNNKCFLCKRNIKTDKHEAFRRFK